uniref:CRISPR-associated endonuclease Cas1 n=1 Tax=Candidatus Kentrum sp. TUN TaxID=2126343 RepID=A0A451A6D0_9GAMM|nr:MAG: CRISPR-associated protein, Cas1 family [Candidatus Kentron sp. TUN]VFK57742.1 MAG: CRISPR-associated protein, Cas1 family [Candidatus Kentron sp. TUN]VFK61584.1 MAG: CRISPR-associated protein, Cas1 family [Candidatus Kentron sp. TUN]
MKKLLNTLYVTTQGAWLARERENVLVQVEKEIRMRLPIHNLDNIICFGHVSASAPFMGLCAERGVGLAFFTEYGRFLTRVQGPISGNVLLRREQYRRSDKEDAAATIAATLVAAKIANSRTVLQRALRDRADGDGVSKIQDTIVHLAGLQRRVRADPTLKLDSVRGLEGAAAKAYFDVFDRLITHTDKAFHFEGRYRRPPPDPVNAMLSFSYTLLRHDIQSAIEGVGLDPQVGFLHRDRPGRPSLALDLMEEMRAFIADRLVLSLINRRQVAATGFKISESGSVHMDDKTRKVMLGAYQERKRDKLRHPFLNENVEIGLIPHIQALLFARHLRGDLDAYPVFVWR